MLTTLLLLPFLYTAHAQSNGCQTPDKQPGFCIMVQFCKTMSDFVAKFPKHLPPEIREKIRPYQCGVSGNKAKVCCPLTPITIDQSGDFETFQFPEVSNHKNINLLPRNCGQLGIGNKIANGDETDLFEFPWMALLSYQTDKGPDFRCGGTIINENYILTAAHCVVNVETAGLNLIGVRVGEYDLRTTKDCQTENGEETCSPPVQDLAIEKVIIHSRFDSKTVLNDIALIRVSKIDLDQDNSRPVCLPLGNTGNFNYTNRRVVVTGWGKTEKGAASPVLLKAKLEVSPRKDCQEKHTRNKIQETQLCAGRQGGPKGVDSCKGDSGGPLHSLEFLHDEPRYIQQGIVSFGPSDCGKVALPGVYTRVAFYLDWILDQLQP